MANRPIVTLGRTEEVVPDEMLAAVATAEPLKRDAARLDESSFYCGS